MRRLNSLVMLLVIALGLNGTGATAAPATSGPASKVHPGVWVELASAPSTKVLVSLAQPGDALADTARTARRAEAVVASLYDHASSSQAALRHDLSVRGVAHRSYWIANVITLEADRALVEALAARPDVRSVELDRPFRVQPEEPAGATTPAQAAGIEPNVSQINAPALWTNGITGTGITYASADTGVQWDHPALINSYRGWDGSAASHDYNWWDAIDKPIVGGSSCGYDSKVPCDDYGHGTHVMGTGVGDDGSGQQIGVAPGARWIACRNMDKGIGRPSTYIECLQFFLAPTDSAGAHPDPSRHAHVISNSYGCPPSEGCTATSLRDAVEAVRAAGVFMAVSAGNEGGGCATVQSPPGLEPAVITVGAVLSNDTIAGFSSRGPVTVDGKTWRKPDLVAPGVSVRSSTLGGGYGTSSGTSMAAPHVAAAAALLWSALPVLRGDVDRTQSILQDTAVPLTSTQGCGGDTATQRPNNAYGYGRIDVLAAYQQALMLHPAIYIPLVVSGQ